MQTPRSSLRHVSSVARPSTSSRRFVHEVTVDIDTDMVARQLCFDDDVAPSDAHSQILHASQLSSSMYADAAAVAPVMFHAQPFTNVLEGGSVLDSQEQKSYVSLTVAESGDLSPTTITQFQEFVNALFGPVRCVC